MHSGRSTSACTISSVCFRSGGSVSLGLTAVTPALTSRIWAPACGLGERVLLHRLEVAGHHFRRELLAPGRIDALADDGERPVEADDVLLRGGSDERVGHVFPSQVPECAAAVGDELLQRFDVAGGLDVGLGLVGLRRQVIAHRLRRGAAPVGEIGIGVGGFAAHGGHVDRFLEADVEHALFLLAPGFHGDLGGNVAPVGDDELGHGVRICDWPKTASRQKATLAASSGPFAVMGHWFQQSRIWRISYRRSDSTSPETALALPPCGWTAPGHASISIPASRTSCRIPMPPIARSGPNVRASSGSSMDIGVWRATPTFQRSCATGASAARSIT